MSFFKTNKRVLVLPRDQRVEVFVLKRVKRRWLLVQQQAEDITEETRLSDVLASLVQRMKLGGVKATVALGTEHATTKVIEVPSQDPIEIRSIIDLQAGRHTPFAREEIMVSHQVIMPFQRSYSKVLLVIVNRQTLQEQRESLEQAGLIVDQFLFEPEALVPCASHRFGLSEDHPPLALVDVGRATSGFSVLIHRKLAYCRRWTPGASALSDTAGRQKWDQHFKESIEGYRQEDVAEEPREVIVWASPQTVSQWASHCVSLMNVEAKTLDGRFDELLDKNATLSLDDLDPTVLALVEMMDRLEIDLTPEDLKAQRTIEEKGRQLIQTGVLVVAVLVLVCVLFFMKLSGRQMQYAAIRKQYYDIRRKVAVLDNIAQRSRVIKNYLKQRQAPLQILKTLYDLTPPQIYYNSVTMEEDGTVVLDGISESMSTVFDLVTALEETDVFKNVKTTSTSAKKDRGKDVAAFTIQMKLESRPDDEVIEEGEDEASS